MPSHIQATQKSMKMLENLLTYHCWCWKIKIKALLSGFVWKMPNSERTKQHNILNHNITWIWRIHWRLSAVTWILRRKPGFFKDLLLTENCQPGASYSHLSILRMTCSQTELNIANATLFGKLTSLLCREVLIEQNTVQVER